MSDFAYAYFNSELEKLDVVSLEEILDKVQRLLKQKRTENNNPAIDENEVQKINNVYDKISEVEQLSIADSSMRTMWEAVKNDSW
ncbi:MAG: hypothetical protein J6K22_05375 [Spirochaetaceae bacterium]|nr:hypothetical protein [Spirochaetaceae bacterium]MBP3449875.1 hypothetical protein [Spirochaetaceae bacterium]MBQ3025367.1 hypothetical protein [Spirochaetaceae bacterium]MBQ7906083.1 hypothetical protein [Spirochaetaceae bacterium]